MKKKLYDVIDETAYGFKWGNVTVERIASDEKSGCILNIVTDRQRLEVRVTPGGKIITKKTNFY